MMLIPQSLLSSDRLCVLVSIMWCERFAVRDNQQCCEPHGDKNGDAQEA
jgi:hypothetical protein